PNSQFPLSSTAYHHKTNLACRGVNCQRSPSLAPSGCRKYRAHQANASHPNVNSGTPSGNVSSLSAAATRLTAPSDKELHALSINQIQHRIHKPIHPLLVSSEHGHSITPPIPPRHSLLPSRSQLTLQLLNIPHRTSLKNPHTTPQRLHTRLRNRQLINKLRHHTTHITRRTHSLRSNPLTTSLHNLRRNIQLKRLLILLHHRHNSRLLLSVLRLRTLHLKTKTTTSTLRSHKVRHLRKNHLQLHSAQRLTSLIQGVELLRHDLRNKDSVTPIRRLVIMRLRRLG